jgi:hypothetical protein
LSYHGPVRATLVAVLLWAPACDRVFGLDRPPDAPLPIDAPFDAPDTLVTGTWRYTYATNGADGDPMIVTMPHPDGLLTVFFTFEPDEDGLRVPLDAAGSFSFPRPPGASYRLQRSSALEGGAIIELQSSVEHIELLSPMAGRPDRAPVTAPTVLTFSPPTATNDERIIASTGLWTETAIAGDAIDWLAATSVAGPLALLDASKGDRLYYAIRSGYFAGDGTPWRAFSAVGSTQLTIVDGMPQMVTLAPVAIAHNRCAKIVAHRVADLAGVLAAASGPGIVLTADDWVIRAVPSLALGVIGGITVAALGETNGATDASLTATYFDPFPGHEEYISMGAAAVRTMTYPGATPTQVGIGDRVYMPVPADCSQTTVLDVTVGFPATPALQGVQLGLPEGQAITVPANGPTMLTWALARSGPVDLTRVSLFQVINEAGLTKLTLVRAFQTTAQTVTIPNSVFVPSQYYAVRIDTGIGAPNSATGDFATLAYPAGGATQWSRMFQVVSP